jgi:hypothetical protein
MKAVVVELKNDFAAVLSDEGCIIKVKNNNYDIGQVIQINRPHSRLPKLIGTFAASAAVFVALSVGAWAYASPYTYVSVDVNPSIEFNINRFDRVLDVKAVNDDGETILDQISLDNLKNKSIEAALTITVEQISESGYFDGDNEGGIVIATSCENMEKADALADQLLQTAMQETSQNGDNVEVDAFSVAPARVQEAKELGVTPGKLNLVEKLQEAAGNSNSEELEEWINKPVKDIMKATKAYKKSAGKGIGSGSGEDLETASGIDTESNSGKKTKSNSGKDTEFNSGKENTALEEFVPEMDTEAESIDQNSESSNNKNQKDKNSNEGTDNKSEAVKKQSKESSKKTAANSKNTSKDSINADMSSDSIEESTPNHKDNTNSRSESVKPNKGAAKDSEKATTGDVKSDSESASVDVNKDDAQETVEKPGSSTKDKITDSDSGSSENLGNGTDQSDEEGVNSADGANSNDIKNANDNTKTGSSESSSNGHSSNDKASNNE